MKKLIVMLAAVLLVACSAKVENAEVFLNEFISSKEEILQGSYYYFETGRNREVNYQTELIVSGENSYARVETEGYILEMYEINGEIFFYENGDEISEGDSTMINSLKEHVVITLTHLEDNYFDINKDIEFVETNTKYNIKGDYKGVGTFEIEVLKSSEEIMFYENGFEGSLEYVIQTMILKEYSEEIVLPE